MVFGPLWYQHQQYFRKTENNTIYFKQIFIKDVINKYELKLFIEQLKSPCKFGTINHIYVDNADICFK